MAHRVEQTRDELGVVGRAAHELASADAVVVGGVEAERVVEDLVTH